MGVGERLGGVLHLLDGDGSSVVLDVVDSFGAGVELVIVNGNAVLLCGVSERWGIGDTLRHTLAGATGPAMAEPTARAAMVATMVLNCILADVDGFGKVLEESLLVLGESDLILDDESV